MSSRGSSIKGVRVEDTPPPVHGRPDGIARENVQNTKCIAIRTAVAGGVCRTPIQTPETQKKLFVDVMVDG